MDPDATIARRARASRVSRRVAQGVLLAGLLLLAQRASMAQEGGTSLVERGRYLATAANCVSCHTRPGGEPFAGGVAFDTPFGRIYSTNITPDHAAGIGRWTQAQFARALRDGVRPNGEHLYPAFPYTAFTKLSDQDTAAIFAYLQTLAPMSYAAPDNALRFPFNQRWLLGIWKTLYFKEGRFMPNASRSKQWNRGAYLVEGPGHCGACHTPRNFLGAEQPELAMTGGTHREEASDGKIAEWSSSNLTPAPTGLKAWSVDDIAAYLNTGFTPRAGVFGPMNEVVMNSTRYLSAEDARAMAVYLKSLPALTQKGGSPPDDEVMRNGEVAYSIHCGTCHLPTGLGSEETGPPLAGSPVALAANPASLINITIYGAQLPQSPPSKLWQEKKWKVMEGFGEKLSDEDAAELLTYIRNSWGNQAGAVTPDQVARQR